MRHCTPSTCGARGTGSRSPWRRLLCSPSTIRRRSSAVRSPSGSRNRTSRRTSSACWLKRAGRGLRRSRSPMISHRPWLRRRSPRPLLRFRAGDRRHQDLHQPAPRHRAPLGGSPGARRRGDPAGAGAGSGGVGSRRRDRARDRALPGDDAVRGAPAPRDARMAQPAGGHRACPTLLLPPRSGDGTRPGSSAGSEQGHSDVVSFTQGTVGTVLTPVRARPEASPAGRGSVGIVFTPPCRLRKLPRSFLRTSEAVGGSGQRLSRPRFLVE